VSQESPNSERKKWEADTKMLINVSVETAVKYAVEEERKALLDDVRVFFGRELPSLAIRDNIRAPLPGHKASEVIYELHSHLMDLIEFAKKDRMAGPYEHRLPEPECIVTAEELAEANRLLMQKNEELLAEIARLAS
jgi:hypothetical protein